MTNIDLTTLLGATVDRAVMAFIDKIGSKYDLPTRELADLWDQTSTGGPVPKVKKALNKLEDSESSSVSEVKVALKKAPAKKVDDGTESSESELKPISRRGKKGDNKPVRRGKKVVESESESDDPPKPTRGRGKKVVESESESDDPPKPTRGRGKKAVESESESDEHPKPTRGRGKKAVESESESDEHPKPTRGRGKNVVESESESDDPPKPTRGRGKKAVESESESDDPPKRRGKKVVESESESDDPPKRRGKKVVESDDSPPPKKKAPVKKKAPARGKRRAYEEVDAPKGGAGYPEPPEDLVFLKDTNYILHDGKVVAGWSKKGFMVLNTVHEKSLNSEVNQDIEYEKLSKDELDELFDMVKVNAKIAESKPPVKRKGKK